MRTASDFQVYTEMNTTVLSSLDLNHLLKFFNLKEGDYLVMPRTGGMSRVYIRNGGRAYVATVNAEAMLMALPDHSTTPPNYPILHDVGSAEVEDTYDVLEHRASRGDAAAVKLLALSKKIFA